MCFEIILGHTNSEFPLPNTCSHVSFFYLLGLIIKFQVWTRGVLYFWFSYPFILNFSTHFYLACVHMHTCHGSRGEVRCPPHLAPCLLSFHHHTSQESRPTSFRLLLRLYPISPQELWDCGLAASDGLCGFKLSLQSCLACILLSKPSFRPLSHILTLSMLSAQYEFRFRYY